MCLILFAYRKHPDRPLVVAANRDEFYARPADAARYWEDADHIFGGRDLMAGGTWLATSTSGRFAAVTNFTDFEAARTPDGSRGDLPRRFLEGEQRALDYVETIDAAHYQGFNLIVFDGEEMVYTSNRTSEVRMLDPGVYGLTNARLDDTWPKAVRGVAALTRVAGTGTSDDVLDLLRDESNGYLPDGHEAESARRATPAFLRGKEYGTRASTSVIFEHRHIEFVEQQYGPMGEPGGRVTELIELCA